MILFVTFLLGLVFGKYLNVCVYRLPKGESLAHLSPHCKGCGTYTKPADLIPVLSWLLLGGKCRYCGENIDWQYIVTELVNAAGWVIIIHYYGLTPQGMAGIFLFSLALVITQIDLEHYLIPNSLVLILLLTGIVYYFIEPVPGLVDRILGLVVGFLIPLILGYLSKGGMGGGDIKLMGAMGFWLGFPGVLYSLFIAALSGSIIGILMIAAGIKKRKDPIPFGPFLVIGFLCIFFFHDYFLFYYWNLF